MKENPIRFSAAAAALAAAAFSAPAVAVTLVGLTDSGGISSFDAANPSVATTVAISNLAAGDRLVAIDLRPGNSLIYGISLSNQLFTVDRFTGAASFVAALGTAVIQADRAYGMDFNPVADFAGAASLRLVDSAGGNFAVNANTGVVGNLASNIGAGFSSVAYSNSTPAPTAAPASTQLYYVDSTRDVLRRATTAFNSPTINDVGSLGLDVTSVGGFDLAANGMGYAAFNTAGGASTGIYGVDIGTGMATLIGSYGGNLTALTIAPIPEPETYALMLAGLAGIAIMRRQTRRTTPARLSSTGSV